MDRGFFDVGAIFIPQWGWAQTATQPKEGDGTQETPYQISTAEELAWFRDYVNENIANNIPQFGIKIVHKKVGSLTNILYLYM